MAHTHTVVGDWTGGSGVTDSNLQMGYSVHGGTSNYTTSSTGTGTNNMNPYKVFNFVIKH